MNFFTRRFSLKAVLPSRTSRKASKGFDFLGKRILPSGILPSASALSRMQKNTIRLYEQGASKKRIEQYWVRWLVWAWIAATAQSAAALTLTHVADTGSFCVAQIDGVNAALGIWTTTEGQIAGPPGSNFTEEGFAFEGTNGFYFVSQCSSSADTVCEATEAIAPLSPASTVYGKVTNDDNLADVGYFKCFFTPSFAMSSRAHTPGVTTPSMLTIGNNGEVLTSIDVPSERQGTDFGRAEIAGGTLTSTFTIVSHGDADLVLNGSTPIVIAGENPDDFMVTTDPSSPLVPGGTTSFVVTFQPSALGLRTATVSISSNDSDENPYTFNIEATGTVSPTNAITNPAAARKSEATSTALTTTWVDAVAGSLAATGYLVSCNTNPTGFTTPTDGTAVTTDTSCSDGAGAQNIGTNVQTVDWAGLNADTQYYFKIFPFSGTGSSINYKTDLAITFGNNTAKTSLDSLAAPTVAASAMFTLNDVCERLNIGIAGSKRSGAFTEPPTAPAVTECSLNAIMAKLPTLDDTNGASVIDVAVGKTFWGLKAGVWGTQTGEKQ